MPVGERVAVVRIEARRIAGAKGLKDAPAGIRKQNPSRTIYQDPETQQLYSVDTQHGRFEVCNPKSGKHLMEVDFDFKKTKDADLTGKHDLNVR